MKIVGVTGGIGSGKTTVCKIFELLGIPVFYADDEAKKLYDEKKIILKVVKLFGKKILSGKKVDKKKLSAIVFNHKSSLAKLNAIIHPDVKRKFEAWKKKQKGAKYAIKEAAIMIESNAYKDVDYLVSITANKSLRINRIINRDKIDKIEIEKRISEQISDKERAKYSDAIIINDGKHSLIKQALKIHRQILSK
ncbi:MAG: dephospho-CoA kinase [Bacteroidetes bacterium]|nr:dephospho-CoA kinase [Bacteroidota bacterium]